MSQRSDRDVRGGEHRRERFLGGSVQPVRRVGDEPHRAGRREAGVGAGSARRPGCTIERKSVSKSYEGTTRRTPLDVDRGPHVVEPLPVVDGREQGRVAGQDRLGLDCRLNARSAARPRASWVASSALNPATSGSIVTDGMDAGRHRSRRQRRVDRTRLRSDSAVRPRRRGRRSVPCSRSPRNHRRSGCSRDRPFHGRQRRSGARATGARRAGGRTTRPLSRPTWCRTRSATAPAGASTPHRPRLRTRSGHASGGRRPRIGDHEEQEDQGLGRGDEDPPVVRPARSVSATTAW